MKHLVGYFTVAYLIVLIFLYFVLLESACDFLTRFIIRAFWVFIARGFINWPPKAFSLSVWCFFVVGAVVESHFLVAERLYKSAILLENVKNPGKKVSVDHHAIETSVKLPLMKGFCVLGMKKCRR